MNVLMLTSAAPKIAPFYTVEKRPPLGVGLLISVLKDAGHNVFFSDEYLRPSNLIETGFLNQRHIDFVGIYANTICFQNTLTMLGKLQHLRESGEWVGKIILGGPHTSVSISRIPDYVDHIVIGEGEIAIVDIVEGREQDQIIKGKSVQDMDSLPRPAWEEFIHLPYDWTDYISKCSPVYTFNTSRGCPFDCRFCSVNAIWGKNYRFMSAEKVVADIEFMKKYYGMHMAYFREDHFTHNKKRIIDFCELLLKKNLAIDWMCETRVDTLVDREYLQLMAKAGCKNLYIGVESGSPRMLEFYRKGETVEQFIKAFDLIHHAGIKTYASFIVGAPTETREDLALTESLIRRIKPTAAGKNIFIGLPGSELYDYVREKNLYEYEDANHILYMKGHNKLVDIYCGGYPYLKTPSSMTDFRIILYEARHKAASFFKHIAKNI